MKSTEKESKTFENEGQLSEELVCLEALIQLPGKATERLGLFPCPGLCCHITEAPLFFLLPTYIACVRTVHCFHFLSALGWLKMHNYHQFAALPVEGPKTITQKKTATASGMLLLSCAPDTSTLLFPNGAFHLYFVVPKQWVVCLFLWFVLDSFWRLKRGKKKRRNWLCSLNMTTKWGFEAET